MSNVNNIATARAAASADEPGQPQHLRLNIDGRTAPGGPDRGTVKTRQHGHAKDVTGVIDRLRPVGGPLHRPERDGRDDDLRRNDRPGRQSGRGQCSGDHLITFLITSISLFGSKGLTSQPVAPAARPACFI